jgi:hypothetical protein
MNSSSVEISLGGGCMNARISIGLLLKIITNPPTIIIAAITRRKIRVPR